VVSHAGGRYKRGTGAEYEQACCAVAPLPDMLQNLTVFDGVLLHQLSLSPVPFANNDASSAS
jgi:hypothetical protein